MKNRSCTELSIGEPWTDASDELRKHPKFVADPGMDADNVFGKHSRLEEDLILDPLGSLLHSRESACQG